MNANKEVKIIKRLRNFKKGRVLPDHEKFLQELRLKLIARMSAHMATYPPYAVQKEQSFYWREKYNFFFRSKLAFIKAAGVQYKAAGAVIVFFILSANGVAFAAKNSLPGESLYTVKIFSESVRAAMAATPETKAKIQSEFTAERVEEIKIIIERKNSNPANLEMALNNLQKNVSETSAIINNENRKGVESEKLVKNINDSLNKNKKSLDQIFEEHAKNLKTEEESIRNKITEAKNTDNRELLSQLNNELNEKETKRKSAEKNREKNKKIFNEEEIKKEGQTENDSDTLREQISEKPDKNAKKKNTDLSE